MITQVTSGVKVSVEVYYRPDQSNADQSQHIFAYNRQVEGEGVIGEKPIIGTGEAYQYISGCNLDSEIGKMYGSYLMERLIDSKQFYVRIPEFQLVVPYKLN